MLLEREGQLTMEMVNHFEAYSDDCLDCLDSWPPNQSKSSRRDGMELEVLRGGLCFAKVQSHGRPRLAFR